MRDPTSLSHGELAHIVTKLQDALFLECYHGLQRGQGSRWGGPD